MDIDNEIQLIRRIKSDLIKEAVKHRRSDRPEAGMAATDCEEQAEGLTSILMTLDAVKMMREASQRIFS